MLKISEPRTNFEQDTEVLERATENTNTQQPETPTEQKEQKKETNRKRERQQARTGSNTTDKTQKEEQREDNAQAHTNVNDNKDGILNDPCKLRQTPQNGDLYGDIVLKDIWPDFTKGEERIIPSPDAAWTPLGKEILSVLERTRNRPFGPNDFRYVQVSKRELDLVKEWRPILTRHDGFRGMAQLVIHAQRDRENADKDYIPIPADSVRAAFGLKPQRSGNQLGALPLIWAYKLFVDQELKWSKYRDGMCRRITQHGVPDAIMDEAISFFHDREGKTPVLFMKGELSRPTKTRFRSKCFEKMDEERRTAEDAEIQPPDTTQRMIEYMNELSRDARSSPGRSMFGEIGKNVDDAVGTLLESVEVGTEVYDKGIRQSIRQLRRFQDMPYMLYQAGGFTPRPTPVGGNHLVGVDSKAIPKLLGDRHISLDLSKAQLAMFAAVAERRYGQDMTETKKSLERQLDDSSDFNLWDSLREATDLKQSRAAKNAVKRGTYSTVFCASENTILHNISKEIAQRSRSGYPDREKVNGFLDHPVIKEVLEARKNARRQISYHDKNDPHTKDAFGRVLTRQDFRDGSEEQFQVEQSEVENDETSGDMREGSKSLLAYIIQSFEVKTMWPIFREAIKERKSIGEDRWRILLYKYDEVILWSKDKRQTDRWIVKATELAEKQADKLGIKTELDVEYDPS